LLLLSLGVAVWLTDQWLPDWTSSAPLNAAFSITIVLMASVVVLAISMFILKVRSERLLRKEEQLRPTGIELLTSIAQGATADRLTIDHLAAFHRRSPRLAHELLSGALALQKGEGSSLLAAAAQLSGIAEDWRRMARSRNAEVRCHAITYLGRLPPGTAVEELRYALGDPEELVRVGAALALINSGDLDEIERIFQALPRQTTLVRALMSARLSKHSVALAAGPIHRALESDDSARIIGALDLLVSWKRSLPAPGVGPLLRSKDDAARARAFQALPYAMGAKASLDDFEEALQAENNEVRCAALSVSARCGTPLLVPRILTLLKDPEPTTATAAGYALASFGMTRLLESTIIEGARPSADIAMEALEKVRIGRLTL
jgi:hypothetical protein